jgi:ribosomal-protein-alanine N-acetyltransferase
MMIRPLGPFDAELAAALHAACFPDDPWSAAAFGHLMTSPGVIGVLIVTGPADAPEPAGLALARAVAGEAEIITIGVVPAHCNVGLGAALLHAVLVQARDMNAECMFLEVAEDNKSARQLYDRHGFVEIGLRPGYYRRGKDRIAALVLRRDLNSVDGKV